MSASSARIDSLNNSPSFAQQQQHCGRREAMEAKAREQPEEEEEAAEATAAARPPVATTDVADVVVAAVKTTAIAAAIVCLAVTASPAVAAVAGMARGAMAGHAVGISENVLVSTLHLDVSQKYRSAAAESRVCAFAAIARLILFSIHPSLFALCSLTSVSLSVCMYVCV